MRVTPTPAPIGCKRSQNQCPGYPAKACGASTTHWSALHGRSPRSRRAASGCPEGCHRCLDAWAGCAADVEPGHAFHRCISESISGPRKRCPKKSISSPGSKWPSISPDTRIETGCPSELTANVRGSRDATSSPAAVRSAGVTRTMPSATTPMRTRVVACAWVGPAGGNTSADSRHRQKTKCRRQCFVVTLMTRMMR